MQKKQKLRQHFKTKRQQLTKAQALEMSLQINRNFIDNLLPKILKENSQTTFSIYLSALNEVSTSLIAQHFEENKITFSYPKISKLNQPLDFILHEKEQIFVPNKHFSKLLEPKNNNKIIPNILILPLVSFDFQRSRLGMGGGFFDRTIEHLKKKNLKITTIGLAYDFQRFEGTLPTEETDQTIDFIVTQNQILSAS